MKKPYNLSIEEKAKAVTMFSQGKGPAKIAVTLKVPCGAVERCLNALGLKRTKEEAYEIQRKRV